MPRLLDHFVVVRSVEAVNAIPRGEFVTVVYPDILSAKKARAIKLAAIKRGFDYAPAPEWVFGPRAAGKRLTWPSHRTTRTWLALQRAVRRRHMFKAILRARNFRRLKRIDVLVEMHVPGEYFVAFAYWMHQATQQAVLMAKLLGHVVRIFPVMHPDDIDYLPPQLPRFTTVILVPFDMDDKLAASICLSATVSNFLYMRQTFNPLLFGI